MISDAEDLHRVLDGESRVAEHGNIGPALSGGTRHGGLREDDGVDGARYRIDGGHNRLPVSVRVARFEMDPRVTTDVLAEL